MDQKKYWERTDLINRRSPDHPVIAEYVLPKIKLIRDVTHIHPSSKVLDVGCGNGFFTFYLNQICNAYGVDYSKKMLSLNPVKKTFLMDGAHLGFKDNSFDMIFCHAFLHHVKNIDHVVSEIRRVTKDYVVILEPNRNNPLMFLFCLLKREERGALKFSLSFLKKVADRNGIEVIDAYAYGLMLPNKTPRILVPFFRFFNFRQPFGMTLFLIGRKK
jgi:ubiquinone/menaquinone biosynthesis C-methylase UbiE